MSDEIRTPNTGPDTAPPPPPPPSAKRLRLTKRSPKQAASPDGRLTTPSAPSRLGGKPAVRGLSARPSFLSALTKKRGVPEIDPSAPRQSRTSFDLLEGGFATARNTRQFNIGLLLFFASLFVFLAGDAVITYVNKSSTASSITVAQSSVSDLNAKIAASTAGGLLPSTISDHHKSRINLVNAIEAKSVDFSLVLTKFQSVAPPGSLITSVIVTPPVPPASQTTVSTFYGEVTTTTAPPTTVPGTTVTVIYVLPSSASTISVQDALGALPFVVPGSVRFSGSISTGPTGSSSSTVTVTFIVTLNDKANVNRAGNL